MGIFSENSHFQDVNGTLAKPSLSNQSESQTRRLRVSKPERK
jgi:hypothetical protein